MLPIIYFLLPLLITPVLSEDPILSTHIGKFTGKTLEFESGVKVDVFLGVPYAKPPVGELRFELSGKPVDGEFVEIRNATTHPKPCVQDKLWGVSPDSSEDCLYLNVYRPHKKTEKGYPGYVFVHGGGFQMGSAKEHSNDYTAKFYAAQGITYIIPQYRLSIFGFGSTGKNGFSGNYGLWDLRQALLFINNNADSMNLDANRITVGGYSAGAGATSALTISEQTRDLFQQSIEMSGNVFAEWAISKRPVVQTEKVLETLGCKRSSKDSENDYKNCLKNKNVEELVKAVADAHPNIPELNYCDFTPRIDLDFFSEDLPELYKSSKPKPTLMTITENEGLIFTIYFSHAPGIHIHTLTPEQKAKFSIDDFKTFIRNTIVPKKVFGEKAVEVQDKITNFYLNLRPEEDHNREFLLDIHAKVLSDIMFVIPQLRSLKLKREAGWPSYAILNTYNDMLIRGIPQLEVKSSTHGSEYGYLFGETFFGKVDMTEKDEKFRDLLIGSIVQFIKTGSPNTPNNNNFHQQTEKEPLVYTELTTESKIKQNLFSDSFEFWTNLTEQYDFDIVRGIFKDTQKVKEDL